MSCPTFPLLMFSHSGVAVLDFEVHLRKFTVLRCLTNNVSVKKKRALSTTSTCTVLEELFTINGDLNVSFPSLLHQL